jgi:hypothetical protein
MKRKIIATILAVVVALTLPLAGCGGRDVSVDTSGFGGGSGGSGNGTWDPGTEGLEDFGDEGDLEQMLRDGTAVQYDRAVLNDPTLNCEVVRTLMPAGWSAGGEVSWQGQSAAYPANYYFYIQNPEGTAQIGTLSGMSYVQPDSNWYQWSPGQFMTGALCPAKALMSPEDYNFEFISTLLSTQDIQVLEHRAPWDEAAQAMEEAENMLQTEIDAILGQSTSGSAEISSVGVDSFYAFENNGQSWKARVFSLQIRMATTVSDSVSTSYGLPPIQAMNWQVPIHLYFVAEESAFDTYEQQGACELFISNYIVNQQWEGAVKRASDQIFAEEANRQSEQWAQMIAQQASSNSASMQQDYSSSSSSGYSSDYMAGWTNTIVGNSYYEGPDGGNVLLDYTQYHYTDGSSIISSDSPINTVGTGLTELEDNGTMGGPD